MAFSASRAAAAMFALVMACPAQAAFPGANGKLAVSGVAPNDDIHTLNPDGTGITPLAPAQFRDSNPAWSPDGARIAFDSSRVGSSEIFVMDADGSNLTMLTSSPFPDEDPYWSPDGTRIVFESTRAANNRDLWVMNADGSDPTRLTSDPAQDRDPSWSPDGTKIAFSSDRESYVCDDPDNPDCFVRPTFRIFTVSAAGGAATRIVSTSPPDNCSQGDDVYEPDWSPSGSHIAYERIWESFCDKGWYHAVSSTAGVRFLLELNETSTAFPFGTAWSPDGTEVAFVAGLSTLRAASANGAVSRNIAQPFRFPSWQPIPVNGYPRPAGASPTEVSLVPAYQPCGSPNRTHGPPLTFGSCNPATQQPGQLTVGTPDANGQGAKSRSNLRIAVLPGDPSGPPDEADVSLRATVTDVRLRSDLSDYTGSLSVRLTLQITDRDNTPNPGGPGPGTVQELTHSHPLPCAGTAHATVGSVCQFVTTVEALVPGAVKELKRAIWDIKRIQVYDGAGNLFMTQGLFVP